jgi:hypothetical protein
VQRVHQPPDGSTAGFESANSGYRTAAAGEMLREKAAHVMTLDRMNRYSPSPEPFAKMFNRLNVSMNGITGVPAVVQITHESVENYGEMAGCHPATREGSFEITLDHSNRQKGRAFSTYCHASSYSFTAQIKAKIGPDLFSIPPN